MNIRNYFKENRKLAIIFIFILIAVVFIATWFVIYNPDVRNKGSFSVSNNTSTISEDYTVDTEICENNALQTSFDPFGSSWMGTRKRWSNCEVYRGGETENPRYNGDSYQKCIIPMNSGVVRIEGLNVIQVDTGEGLGELCFSTRED